MNTLIVLFAVVSVALCYPWGVPQQVHDTPEVEAAKAAHFAAHSKAGYSGPGWGAQDRSWSGPEDDGSWSVERYGDGNSRSDDGQGYRNDNGQSDDGSYKDDGSWRNYDDGSYKGESPSWGSQDGGHYDNHEKKWTGPVALPPGYDKNGAPLQVLDTPEVAAAKSKHFHLYHAAAHGAHSFH